MSSPQLVPSSVVACSKFTVSADANDGIATNKTKKNHRIRCIGRFHTIKAAMVKASSVAPTRSARIYCDAQVTKRGRPVRPT
jgi:hypothetical protein